MIPRRIARAAAGPALAGLVGVLLLGAASPGSGRTPNDPKQADRIDRLAAKVPPRPAARVVLVDGRDLFLQVVVAEGDSADSLGRTYLEDPRLFPAVQGLQAESLPAPGGSIRIPYELLHPDWVVRALRELFPADRPGDGHWVHQVGAGRLTVSEESLWNLSLWFTGRGENFEAIADRNGLHDLAPRPGQPLIVPGDLLLPPFARLAGLPPPERPFDDDFSRIVTRRAPVPEAKKKEAPEKRPPEVVKPEPEEKTPPPEPPPPPPRSPHRRR